MRAHSTLSLDDGMSTVSWAAWIALRIRVRKSAMGSVLALKGCLRSKRLGLPGGLGHAGDEAVVRHLAQADPAQAELAVHGAGTAAAAAPAVLPGLELRGPSLADPLGRLGHLRKSPRCPARRDPAPASRTPRGSLPSAARAQSARPRPWCVPRRAAP